MSVEPRATCRVTVRVNGKEVTAEVEARLLLVHFIRENLDLTGTHIGCDTSNCGACTVLLNGQAVKSCTLLTIQADGAAVETVEGLEQNSVLHALQEGFFQEHGLQCGFCTPGMLMSAKALLADNPSPTEAEIRRGISGQPVSLHGPPGGVAYRCSFRVTEAVHAIERMVDCLALKLDMDPAELRMKNFIQPEQFPYKSVLGWEYDSGNYPAALTKALDKIGYAELRQEQLEKRARGELMGIGISTFTEIVGAGPSDTFDILGIKMFDSAEIRIHPTGSAVVRIGVQTQGQGHETTFAQIVAEELGLTVENIDVEHGDTDTAPYGLGTYASRSTPTAGAATAMAARKIREKASHLAAHLLECSVDDLEWIDHKFQVKGAPERTKSMTELAFAAYTNHPQGMEAGLEAVCYYDPPNLTFPFGAYIAVVDIDRGTGEVKVRRFVAIDDCGTVINPMIVEGQIHGGLTMGLAPALYEQIWYDPAGNMHGGTLMDYLVPTSMETPAWETDRTVTPSPHHPFGAKGVGESATVGAPPAIANAVVDALSHLGVTHVEIPMTPPRMWKILQDKGVAL